MSHLEIFYGYYKIIDCNTGSKVILCLKSLGVAECIIIIASRTTYVSLLCDKDKPRFFKNLFNVFVKLLLL